MAVNKVQKSNGEVIIDITDTTATADKILTGYTAYGSDGVKVYGTAIGGPSTNIRYLYENSSGNLVMSAELPPVGSSNVKTILLINELTLNYLKDSTGKVIVDSNGKQIVTANSIQT